MADETISQAVAAIVDPNQRWGSVVEVETRRRIHIAAAAYAYEIENDPIMSDAQYDADARLIDTTISTSRPDLDAFFRANFAPNTGSWVGAHPDRAGLAKVAASLRRLGTYNTFQKKL